VSVQRSVIAYDSSGFAALTVVDDDRVLHVGDLAQAREEVVLAVRLALGVELLAEAPLLHLVGEVREVLEVVGDGQDRPAGDELDLLTGVRHRDEVGGVAGADEQRLLVVPVGQRDVGPREGDVLVGLQVLEDRPVLLHRVVRVVAVHQREVDRLRGLEGRADLEVLHGADGVLGVDRDGATPLLGVGRVAAPAAARGQDQGQGGRGRHRGGRDPDRSHLSPRVRASSL
jgi:hypothetical protein